MTVGVYTPEEVADFAPEPARHDPRVIEVVEADVEMPAIMAAVAAATTLEALRAILRDARRLPESEKNAATAAVMARKAELEETP